MTAENDLHQLSNAILSRLEEFTQEELIHLNHVIVERLRLMTQVRAHQTMINFRIGQRVQFTASDGRQIVGTLTKFNRKSVTICAGDAGHWRVAPSIISEAK